MKKIGVIGSGSVGETLADGFLRHGYEVMRGSRDVAKLADWKKKSGKGQLARSPRPRASAKWLSSR